MGFEQVPQPKPKVEKPRMTFGERIAKGVKEGDPKWEAARQKVDIVNEAMRNIPEETSRIENLLAEPIKIITKHLKI